MPIAKFSSSRKDGSEQTEMDQQHARLIAALIAAAKHLQVLRKCVANGDADQGAVCSVEMMVCLDKLYGSDGHRMESEARALAKLLGFDVQLYNVTAATGVSH